MKKILELAWGLNIRWPKWECSICKESIQPAQKLILVREGRVVIGVMHSNCIDGIVVGSSVNHKSKHSRCIICGQFNRYLSFFRGRQVGYSSTYTYYLHYSCLCNEIAKLSTSPLPPTRVVYFSLKDMNAPSADFVGFSLEQLRKYEDLENIRSVFKGFSTIKSIRLGNKLHLEEGMLTLPIKSFRTRLKRFQGLYDGESTSTYKYSCIYATILSVLRGIGDRVCGKRLYDLYIPMLEIGSLSHIEALSLLPLSLLVTGLYSTSPYDRSVVKESILLQEERSEW